MDYPTMAEVEAADRVQLCRWFRHLPSPGMASCGEPGFDAAMAAQSDVMDRIIERFTQAGGMTPEISKAIGWEEGATNGVG